MPLNIVADQSNNLPSITDAIHDCWFDKEDIVFHKDSSILEIKFDREVPENRKILKNFLLLKEVQIPVIECILRIYHIKTCQITDTEKVGRYDFNKLEYDPNRSQICVRTGVPIDIKVTVNGLRIAVEETGRKLEDKVTWVFF
ncbi:MAG: hypothetical protein A2901_03540 [Elusimicrobia bacterium RIFCSPLOWO2_01_FULL_54_10]|nr:MAG: hypothetical protein A2901_03540 [Elusimicrobia bacterium RIFCSPLOWO2_01_FULL_54_10]